MPDIPPLFLASTIVRSRSISRMSRSPVFGSMFRYVRRAKGKFQARVYVCNPENGWAEWINLGLYQSQYEASRAVEAFVERGERPAHLLPKYVRRCEGGGYVGVVKLRDARGIIRTTVERTPEKADRAMRRLLLDIFGPDEMARFYPFG